MLRLWKTGPLQGAVSEQCRWNWTVRAAEYGKLAGAGAGVESPAANKKTMHSDVSCVDIESAVFIMGQIGNNEMLILVDTGAAFSIIREDLWLRTKLQDQQLQEVGQIPRLVNASGDAIDFRGRCEVSVKIAGQIYIHPMLIVRKLSQACLLGADFLRKNKLDVVMSRETIRLPGGLEVPIACVSSPVVSAVTLDKNTMVPAESEVIIRGVCKEPPIKGAIGLLEPSVNLAQRHDVIAARSVAYASHSIPVRLMNPGNKTITLYKGTILGTFEPCVVKEQANQPVEVSATTKCSVGSNLFDLRTMAPGDRSLLSPLLDEFSDVFSRGPDDIGRTNLVYHKIITRDAVPIRQPPRRVPIHRREQVGEMIKSMQKNRIIVPSESPWSSPVVLAMKKDGSLRFCVDFRRLNDVTVKDAYPLPRIDTILETVAGARYFSTLDLASGYWQVEIAPEDRQKTAFSTGNGLWEFNVLPFGCCNGPGTYQRLMDRVLAGLQWETCAVYLDDVIVWSATVQDHMARLREIFTRLREAHLKLQPSKCQFLKSEVSFLGHRISEAGVATDPDKVGAVRNWPTPMNVEQLRTFVGFASYYRRFVKGFADIAAPLHRLTQKGLKFAWSDACNDAFNQLRQKLSTTPVLSAVRHDGDFVLDTDASDTGLGVVLSQLQDGQERVIAYASCGLTKRERQYCVTRRELLAVVYGTKYFRHYLLGRPFLIRTDHNSLRWLRSFKNPEGQVARWLERLAEFEFTIQHRPGKSHANADGLSRLCRQCGQEAEEQTTLPVSNITPEETVNKWNPAWTVGEVQRSQEEDADISVIKKWLREGPRPSQQMVSGHGTVVHSLWAQWDRLIHSTSGVLYRRWTEEGRVVKYQLVTPRTFREEIMKALHDSVTGGHLGMFKTSEKIRERFYWPGWQTDVELWCRQCAGCSARKPPAAKPRAPMVVRASGYPLQRIAIDLLGPLPRTEKGNKYIVVIADYFTKWTEAFALPNMEAGTVAAKIVEEFICRFGVPTEIHTDQGRQFESKLFAEMCSMLSIKKTRTTPYHPQSDGLVERFNRTLGAMLSQYVNDHHTDWDKNLCYVMLAYRSSVQETTRFTPHFLMFGREVRLPIDAVFGRPEPHEAENTEWARELREALDTAYKIVRQKQGLKQKLQKDVYDRRCNGAPYQVGDRVWLYEPAIKTGLAKKLQHPWRGPYKIKARISDVTYRIALEAAPRRRIVVHFNRMKPYVAKSTTEYLDDHNVTNPVRARDSDARTVEHFDSQFSGAEDDLESLEDVAEGAIEEVAPDMAEDAGEEVAPDMGEEGVAEPETRYPQRARRPPQRLKEYYLT